LAGGYRLVRASSRLILWPAIAAYAAGALFLEPLTSFQTSGVVALAIGTVLAGAWPRRTSSVDAIRPVQIGLGSHSAPAAI
jgi:membrane protein implicated in regulation of membrane protease activity